MDRYQKFIQTKAQKKRELLGGMFFPRTPVLLLDFSKTQKMKQKNDLLDGLTAIGLTTVVIVHQTLENELPKSPTLRYFPPERKNDALGAADFVIVPDGDMDEALSHGCVPIAQLDGEKTTQYNPLQEKGNGFYFKNGTKWEMFAAIVRALETYQFPYDWENLIREIINSKN